MSPSDCPFCSVAAERIFHAGAHVLAIWDGFPISSGHALIIPKRHIASWFEVSPEERTELINAIEFVRDAIMKRHKPDGFNIGINEGASAGQTIQHLHIHVIPRYEGDVSDPRGGIRHIIPDKADYWSGSAKLATHMHDMPHEGALIRGDDDPLLPHLIGHFDGSSLVQIAVAFILPSGLVHVEPHLQDLLDRGGAAQVLTGDYLDVSDPDALQRLLDLKEKAASSDRLALRVFEANDQSFHPKAYLFHDRQGICAAYVGSSNLTATALKEGVEWNYRVIPARDQQGLLEVERQFRSLWQHSKTRSLDQQWLDDYRGRRKSRAISAAVPDEPPAAPPVPHEVQEEALAALAETRKEGNSAGLVVLATGLGKTWLSAFDSKRPEFHRVLFVAHREEILAQAMSTFRRIRPKAYLGKYTGQEKVPDADVLFASIQTLGRLPHLRQFNRQRFDYIVVDEFHHAAARTYRRLIDYFEPKFLLGLTATPERTDGGDLLGLCNENLVFRRDVNEGIRLGLLCPFKYFGVPDEVDYSNIPWRSSRFEEEALTHAVATQKRAKNVLEQYRKRAGSRTLAFCCSKRHADFMAEYFSARGLRAVAVHSGEASAPRATSLEKLEAGALDVVFAVDMFNEGVDLPRVDTVLMLRPTESRILWLQQFGRGLRVAENKPHLTIIDYIGNHRVFLIKPQTLLQLGSGDFELARALEQLQTSKYELPPGCDVTYELEAVSILKGLLRIREKNDSLVLFYENFKDRHGARPTAMECFHEGYLPRAARPSHGSWFAFAQAQGDLAEEQQLALKHASQFLEALESTQMTRSYKMLVLLAMLNLDGLPGQVGIEELTAEFGRIARRSARLRNDVGEDLNNPESLKKLIEQNPINAWIGGRGTGGKKFFSYDDEKLICKVDVPVEAREAFQELTRELTDWRLAEYLARGASVATKESFSCKVSHAGGRPMLFLPDRESHPDIPFGWTPIVADDNQYEANFVKIAVNVMRREDSEKNDLPEILYGWFGQDAGRPGTNYQVVFEKAEQAYIARPKRMPGQSDALEIGRSYRRDQVPPLFGTEYRGQNWQTGFISHQNQMILFVTLKKEGLGKQYAYRDRFLSDDVFEWQSQNRTPQRGKVGQNIKNHEERGINVHLFVRKEAKIDGKTLPFVYCGQLRFIEWENEKPITVRWKLDVPLMNSVKEYFLQGLD